MLTEADSGVETECIDQHVVEKNCSQCGQDVYQRHVEDDGGAGILVLEIVHSNNKTEKRQGKI